MYSSKAIANHFLQLGERDGTEISPMKIQKLVYYAHGWHLGYVGDPLIDEQIECWAYGPVIDTLFHDFKQFGSDPITCRASKWIQKSVKCTDGTSRLKLISIVPTIASESDTTTAERYEGFVADVWDAYGDYSATRLSNMTHTAGGPWHTTFKKYNGHPPKGTDIDTDIIRAYFATLIKTSQSPL